MRFWLFPGLALFASYLQSSSCMAHMPDVDTLNAVDYPIGIHFGHTELSSAYYNLASEIQLITTIPSSSEWQEYFLATMKDRRNHAPYDDPQNMALCTETLTSIITATTLALGKSTSNISISAFSVPQQFNDVSSFVNIQRSGQVVSHFNSARLAYGLDNCAAVNLPADCDFDEEENFVFVVDYGKAYLSLGFSIVGKMLYAQVGERHWTELEDVSEGQNEVETDLRMHTNAVKSKSGEQQQQEDLAKTPPCALQKIQNFLSTQLSALQDDVPDLPSHVIAVILTGEAPSASISAMKTLLEEALPAFKPKFKFSISPRLVGVQGAAHRARQTVTDAFFTGPKWRGDHDLTVEEKNPRGREGHDEL